MSKTIEKSLYMRLYYLDEAKIEKMPAEMVKNIILGVMKNHRGEEVVFDDQWTEYEYELLKERTEKDEKAWMDAKAKHAAVVAKSREKKTADLAPADSKVEQLTTDQEIMPTIEEKWHSGAFCNTNNVQRTLNELPKEVRDSIKRHGTADEAWAEDERTFERHGLGKDDVKKYIEDFQKELFSEMQTIYK